MHRQLCCSVQSDLETYLHGFLRDHVGLKIHKERPREGGRMATGGVTAVKPDFSDQLTWRLCVVLEAKREIGSKGDSNFQGASYYGIWWQARQQSPFLQRTCCPALLLEVVGPHLRVSALYWLHSVVVCPLTPLINLLWFGDNEEHMITIARTLAAVRATQQKLAALYVQPPAVQGLPDSSSSSNSLRPDFLQLTMPYPMADYAQASAMPTGRRVYTATVPSSGEQVLVRFVRRYGGDAHAAWAAAGLAPQLRLIKPMPGAWFRVEMELLEATDGWVELASWRGSDVAAATRAAQAALVRAHTVQGTAQQVFAHGEKKDGTAKSLGL